LYAYDIPSKVGVKIATSIALRLASEGIIRGIKDSSGDIDEFRRLKRDVAGLDHFSLITGSDSTADLALLKGADGMIAGMANVDPHGFVRLYAAAAAADWAVARSEQERLFSLRDIVRVGVPRIGPFSATIASSKSALVYRGIIASDALQLPLLELNGDERAMVGKMLADFGLSRVA
jgi:4-hydroxy-tetrahydrodipicolinate synthase